MSWFNLFNGDKEKIKKENNRLYYVQEESIMERINKQDKLYLIECRNFIENILKEAYSEEFNLDDYKIIDLIELIDDDYLKNNLHDIRIRANDVAHKMETKFNKDFVENDLLTLDKLIDFLTENQNLNKYEFFSMTERIKKEFLIEKNKIYSSKNNSINFEKIDDVFEINTDINKEYYVSSYNARSFCMAVANDRYYSKELSYECPSIFYVVHNILIRKDMVRKSNYLNNLLLNSNQLDLVRKYEIVILHAMKYGAFYFNEDDVNEIYTNNEEIKYAQIAYENIMYYAKMLNNMQKHKNKLNYDVEFIPNSIDLKDRIIINQKDIKIEIIDDLIDIKPIMWFTDKIDYELTKENESYFVEMLKDLFGHKNFRIGQLDVIKNILENNIVNIPLSVFPTGYGKSLIYQFCAILEPQKTIVICPTEVLACDQIFNLNEDGLNIGQIISCYEKNLNDRNGNLIFYAVPEVFLNNELNEKLVQEDKKDNIYNIVLDECHNISLWGHQFDPIYFSLSKNIINSFKNCNVTMFTATASELVINDIKNQFPNHNIEIYQPVPLDRGNIKYQIKKVNSLEDLIKDLSKLFDSNYGKNNNWDLSDNDNLCKTLIINNDYEILKQVYNGLQEHEKILPYVSIFNNSVGSYKSYRTGSKKILLSDDDFVVGINIPKLVNLVCIGVPPSKEWLYQESGRVGRNLEESNIIIYIPSKPSDLFSKMIDTSFDIKELILNKNLKSKLNIDVSNINYFNSYFQDKKMQLLKFNEVEKGVNDNIYVVNNSDIGEINLNFDTTEKETDNYLFYMLCLMDYVKNWQTRLSNNIDIIKYRMFVRSNVDLNELIDNVNKVITVSTKNIKLRSKYIRKNNNAKDIKQLLENLLDWYYETIIVIKREMLINTYELLLTDKISSEEIETNLAAYFTINDSLKKKINNDIKKELLEQNNENNIESNEYYSEDDNESIEDFENTIIEIEKEENDLENNIVAEELENIVNNEIENKIENNIIDDEIKEEYVETNESLTDKLLNIVSTINSDKEIDFSFFEVYNNLNKEEKYNLQFILQRKIESGYIYGYEMIMALLDLEKNGSKLLRFSKFVKNTNKELIEILLDNIKNNVSLKNKRKAYKIIYNIYKPQNLKEWIRKIL